MYPLKQNVKSDVDFATATTGIYKFNGSANTINGPTQNNVNFIAIVLGGGTWTYMNRFIFFYGWAGEVKEFWIGVCMGTTDVPQWQKFV